MKKIWITFSTSYGFTIWWTWIKTFNINSLLYSLFHICMSKTNYDQLENFETIEKKIGKSSVNLITAFDHKYMKETMIQFKSKKFQKSIHWTLEKFLIELKGKPGQISVNALLNKFSSVNPLPFPYIIEFDSLRWKTFWLCTVSIYCLNMDYPLA